MPARVVENRNPFMNDPLFRQFFGAVPREQVLRSLGSGVIIDPVGPRRDQLSRLSKAPAKCGLRSSASANSMPKSTLKDEHSDLAVLRLKGERASGFPRLNSAIPTSFWSAIWCWRSVTRWAPSASP